MRLIRSTLAATLAVGLFAFTSSAAPLGVLFLGDNAGHRPTNRFALMQAALASRGIEMTYTDKLDSLNSANLARYDALVIYANHTRISPEQQKALLDYVESGHGFMPIHCASFFVSSIRRNTPNSSVASFFGQARRTHRTKS
jgi:type 1 glutamine amidotransferase